MVQGFRIFNQAIVNNLWKFGLNSRILHAEYQIRYSNTILCYYDETASFLYFVPSIFYHWTHCFWYRFASLPRYGFGLDLLCGGFHLHHLVFYDGHDAFGSRGRCFGRC